MGILYIRNKDGNLIPLQSSTSCDSIKTINGIKPDENGNIEIIIPDIPSSNEKSDEVYILGKNETFSDVPDGITVVIDPDGNPDFDLSKYVKISELNSAINTALTSAKNSGEFDGAPGYTPVKGTDYYTEADKTEMVNDVLSALPTWTGGSY